MGTREASGACVPLSRAGLVLISGAEEVKATPAHTRFWSKVVKAANGCWLWAGAIASDTGYGIFFVGDDRRMGAHVFAWELAHPGVKRDGLVVRHTCDTPNCVNPQHLVLGTHADNMKDMDERGRRVNNPVRGEAHHNSKLTREVVEKARRAVRNGTASVAQLARQYGVSTTTMQAAVEGKTWRR